MRVELVRLVSDRVLISVDSLPVRAAFIVKRSGQWPCGAPERICADMLEGLVG